MALVKSTRLIRTLAAACALAAVPISTFASQPVAPSQAAQNAGMPYLRALAEAGAAYSSGSFDRALNKLDIADQIQPDVPDTWTMRGAIYAEQQAFDKAEDAFEKAATLNPGDFWAPYNLAELLLMQKKYGAAAAAFQKLTVYGGHDELVQFKIVFADVLDGKADDAKPVLDAMKFPSDTPAYYFAHAAWGFAHKDAREGNYWSATGLKVFGLERCISYYDALVGVGWLSVRNADGTVPERTELATMPAATPALGAVPGLSVPALGATPP